MMIKFVIDLLRRLRHAEGQPCDREGLMKPFLGLYGQILQERDDPNIKPIFDAIEPGAIMRMRVVFRE